MQLKSFPRFFLHQGYHLYGVMYLPDPLPDDACGLVLCPPFADEAVHAHRVLVECGRRLAKRGIAAFLFDYVGTGDSEGRFGDGSFARYVDDIRGAVAYFKTQSGVNQCGLLGLRLGANLAMEAVTDLALSPVVLWAPIQDLREYFRGFLRLRLFTETVAFGRPGTTVRLLEERLLAGHPVDVLGYTVSASMAREFLDSSRDPLPLENKPTLVVEVSHDSKAPHRGRSVSGDGPTGPAHVTFHRIPDEPFWERARVGRHEELFGVTMEWIAGALAP